MVGLSGATPACPPAPVVPLPPHMEAADQLSSSVWETEQDHQPPSLNSLRSDSGMNSLEYWDYTVELTQLEGMGQSAGTCTSYLFELHSDTTKNKRLKQEKNPK